MKRVTLVAGFIAIVVVALISTNCKQLDGMCESESFVMYVVNEQGESLLDTLDTNNFIEKIHPEVVCEDGRVIPLNYTWLGREEPYYDPCPSLSTNTRYFDASLRYSFFLVQGFTTEKSWKTSFKIRIPEYNIELNVTGQYKEKSSSLHWWVNDELCTRFNPFPDDPNEDFKYADYKLVLPVK